MRLVRLLRRDPLFTGVFGALTLLTVLPVFVTPVLPLQDLPVHTALASMLGDILTGAQTHAGQDYSVRLFSPYWTIYFVLWIGAAVVGPLAAAKVLAVMATVGLPLAAARLCTALGRDPRLALFAFVLCWDKTMAWGFIAFRLGACVAIWALAMTVQSKSWRDLRFVVPVVLLVVVTHVHAFFIYALLSGVAVLVAGRRFKERLVLHTLALIPGVLAMIPWLLHRMGGKSGGTSFDKINIHFTRAYQYSLDLFTNETASTITALVFVLVPVWSLVLARASDGERTPEDRTAVAFFVTLVICYIALPITAAGNWGVYPRYATLALLSAMLLPRLRLDGLRALWLAPPVAAAVAMAIVVTWQFAGFGSRVRPFLQVIAAADDDASLMPLVFKPKDEAFEVRALDQLHAYVIAERGGYNPLLFENSPNMPVYAKPEKRKKRPPWGQMARFNMERHGRGFDLILVQGLARDPIKGNAAVEEVFRTAPWALYRVKKPKAD